MTGAEFYQAFADRGFFYHKELIYNFYTALSAKPFVILTGISGAGKSKLAELFADIWNGGDRSTYALVPVKPNWRDSKGVFGYYNQLDDSYCMTPALKLFLRALSSDRPHFLILDEMNLAKVEQYFADYLSIIESRRPVPGQPQAVDTAEVFQFDRRLSLSYAIILAALDIGHQEQFHEVGEYRNNVFPKIWRRQFSEVSDENWTPQFRTELNQGDNRLAHRVFESAPRGGAYRLKELDSLAPEDRRAVEEMQLLYQSTQRKISDEAARRAPMEVRQQNIVLHDQSRCLGVCGDGRCDVEACPYADATKYRCPKLYDSASERYLVPPELPIPLNLFTVGTVNVDETTYMFSPKVLDRSNVIEFNEVDFAQYLNAAVAGQAPLAGDARYFFPEDGPMPGLEARPATRGGAVEYAAAHPRQLETLMMIDRVMQRRNLHFGYRVFNEIAAYVTLAEKNGGAEFPVETALDLQVLQKILPKLHGSHQELWDILAGLFGICAGLALEGTDQEALEGALQVRLGLAQPPEFGRYQLTGADLERFPLPRSARKLWQMLHELERTGFASFIQ